MRDFDRQSLRERIERLQLHEALALALDAYDALRGDVRNAVADVAQVASLSPAPALLLLTLWDARGRVVTFDHLSDRSREVFGDYASQGAHRSSAKHVRAAIRAKGWPMTIRSYCRIGYVLERQRGWPAPWEYDT